MIEHIKFVLDNLNENIDDDDHEEDNNNNPQRNNLQEGRIVRNAVVQNYFHNL